MSEPKIGSIVETNLPMDDDYQIECMQVEPDSAHCNTKCHSEDL